MNMTVKTILCLSAVVIQCITAQFYDNPTQFYDSPPQYDCPSPPPIVFTKTLVEGDGCPITVTCSCPIAPSGVSLLSDLGMNGQLAISGSMPFLSAVQMQGKLPSSGQANVNYGCGDSVVITQETGNPCGPNAKAASGLSLANLAIVR